MYAPQARLRSKCSVGFDRFQRREMLRVYINARGASCHRLREGLEGLAFAYYQCSAFNYR